MLVMPAWAMLSAIPGWYARGSYLLVAIAAVSLLLEIWMVAEALLLWPKVRGVAERPLPPLPARAEPAVATANAVLNADGRHPLARGFAGPRTRKRGAG